MKSTGLSAQGGSLTESVMTNQEHRFFKFSIPALKITSLFSDDKQVKKYAYQAFPQVGLYQNQWSSHLLEHQGGKKAREPKEI